MTMIDRFVERYLKNKKTNEFCFCSVVFVAD